MVVLADFFMQATLTGPQVFSTRVCRGGAPALRFLCCGEDSRRCQRLLVSTLSFVSCYLRRRMRSTGVSQMPIPLDEAILCIADSVKGASGSATAQPRWSL